MSVPGPSTLIAGDMQAGFFGEVLASELFTASEIASECGITEGTAQHENEPWLKFAIEGEIIFRPRKPIRYGLSWNHINLQGCVYGEKTITKNGLTYKVRLMRGALTDPSKHADADSGAKGSEWNRLILPIHVQAADKSWAYPAYVEDDIPDWGIGYTDADLLTHNSHGNGAHQWCQETSSVNSSTRVTRGSVGVSHLNVNTYTSNSTTYGWTPVLELLNVPPEISGQDKDLGEKIDAFSYAYNVSDADGTITNITEMLNGEIVNSFDNPTELSREFTITKEQLDSLAFFKTHTIEIIATDDLGGSTTRTLTFSRGVELLPIDSPLLDVVDSVGELIPFIQDGKNAIGDAITGVDDSVVIPADPTFQQLADAIGLISTGKKWANGVITSSNSEISVSGLDFTPSTVVFNVDAANFGMSTTVFNTDAGGFSFRKIGSSSSPSRRYDGTDHEFIEGGFTIKALHTNTLNYEWIAYE